MPQNFQTCALVSYMLVRIAQRGSSDRLQNAWHNGKRVLCTARCGNFSKTEKHKRLLLCLLLDNDSSQYLAFCPFNHHVSLRKPAFTATIFQHSLYPPCRPTHSPSTLFHRSIADSHHCCVDRCGHHNHLCAIQFPIGSPSAAECSDTCNPRGIPHSRTCLLWSSFES